MANRLIPLKNYEHFLKKGIFDRDTICQFARQINRDPAIILGRLQNDGIVPYDDRDTYREVKSALGHQYKNKTIEPTCTQEGYTEHKCIICGDKYSKKIEKLGHLLKVQKAKRATYFETGYTGDTICTRCEEILEKGKKIKKLILAKPSIKTTVGKKKIKLVINKVTDATKYEIKVQLGKKTKTYYTTKTTYTLKKLKSKKKYTIKIRAIKIQGNQKVYSSSVRKKVKVK